jgi:hypothetical protein
MLPNTCILHYTRSSQPKGKGFVDRRGPLSFVVFWLPMITPRTVEAAKWKLSSNWRYPSQLGSPKRWWPQKLNLAYLHTHHSSSGLSRLWCIIQYLGLKMQHWRPWSRVHFRLAEQTKLSKTFVASFAKVCRQLSIMLPNWKLSNCIAYLVSIPRWPGF